MEDDKIIKTAAVIIIASVAIPVVIGAVSVIGTVGYNTINKIKFNRKIKNGLTNGSIIEVDGQYYEV